VKNTSSDEHLRHLYEGEPDEDLVEALEPDQLVHSRDRRLPQRRLGSRAQVGLWALRLFVLATSALVVFTFVASLSKPA
jgi:hypothetical protein